MRRDINKNCVNKKLSFLIHKTFSFYIAKDESKLIFYT